jgi:GNAT superfamily N-acetyltransferase
VDIIRAETPSHLEAARLLFREYERFLAVDLCFQNFKAELAELPGKYAPSQGGALLLAMEGNQAAGCVALRGLEPVICEMKRLFVRPTHRGLGVGRRLAMRIIEEARTLGYERMRLDTLARLTEAVRLYRSLGFVEISAYYSNPLPGVVYWELVVT